ncbi:MAG TPA: HlyD family efflux transporter periplasmic adaptor subunit [Thermoanaerobaculia bacterium]|nr:HlyD family efflux transporter periplasmic adaptor subunit [Thermoanaerobaculia bacterium]
MRGRSKALLAGAAAVLAAAGWLAARARAAGDEVQWVAVERADLVLGVEIEGELEAREAAFLGAPSISRMGNFRIAFMAPEGSRVAAGERVLAFDTTELDQRLQERLADRDSAEKEIEKRATDLAKRRSETELQLAEARARLRRAGLELEVPEDLVAARELAGQRIDSELARREIAYLEERLELLARQAAAELGALAERRAAAAARVREVEGHLERMRVPAPRDGVVIYATNWQGEKSKVGDTVWRGMPLLQVPDLSRLQGAGRVDEADAGALAAGQRVTLRLDAHPDRPLAGRVARIGRTVQRRSPRDPVKVVRLEIALDQVEPELMRPGMRFRGQVELERAADVLVLPAAAVTATPEGPVVFRRTALGFQAVRPELGRRSEDEVEVVSGLAAGERVALGVPEGALETGP